MKYTYTSNSNNKWGIVSSDREPMQYVEKKTHSLLALVVVALPLLPIAYVIYTHMPK